MLVKDYLRKSSRILLVRVLIIKLISKNKQLYLQNENRNFSSLTTNSTVTDPVYPRKVNKFFITEGIETIVLKNNYSIE
jgi:hypothetical protein